MRILKHNISLPNFQTLQNWPDTVEEVLQQHELVVQDRYYRWRKQAISGSQNKYILEFDHLKKIVFLPISFTNRIELTVKEHERKPFCFQLIWHLSTSLQEKCYLDIVNETNSALEQAVKDSSHSCEEKAYGACQESCAVIA